MNTSTSLKNKMHIDDFQIYTYLAPNQNLNPINIFFSHANGIPALTYKNFFQTMSQEFNINIITYDMRGIGKTKIKEIPKNKEWNWQTLVQDYIFLFEHFKQKMPGAWILSGHSLGAWLSLLSAEKLGVTRIWLFDPPILSPQISFKWMLAVLINKKHLSPNSKKVRRRKTQYNSYDEAYDALKQSSFMKNWTKESIYHYLEGSFSQQENCIQLRHNPEWEAQLFEDYPITAFVGFLKLSKPFRKQIKPLFFIGEKSDICHIKSKPWVKLFFPQLQWIPIKNGSHMFPIELTKETINHLSQFI